MGFEQGLRDNGALLGTLGAAAALRNQSIQQEELRKQSRILQEHAETEKQKLAYEQKRLELEQGESKVNGRTGKDSVNSGHKKAIKN